LPSPWVIRTKQKQHFILSMLLKKRGLGPIRFTRLPKPRTGFGGLFGFIDKISIGGIMCLAARQHTGGTSIPPLLLRRPWTMPRSPRRHPPIVGCSHDGERDTRSLGIRLETVGFWELLLPFANILGRPCFHALVGLERNVCPRIFPRHLATPSGRAFTLLVLFSGEPAEISGGPVHCYSYATSISPGHAYTHSAPPVSWLWNSLSQEYRRRVCTQPS